MDFKTPSDRVTRLAVRWPACDAKKVHVTFAESNWETPGVELQRQPDGEFMCFLGEQKHFKEIFFKFIIDGTKWEVNRSIPVVFDEYGYENNRWTLKEAAEYHDSCFRVLERRLTLTGINWVELCGLALSIHGETDKDGRQLECVVDEDGFDLESMEDFKFSLSGSLSEIVFLRFQPLVGKPEQASTTKDETPKDNQEMSEYADDTGRGKGGVVDKKHEEPRDTWVAKFPADLGHRMLPYQISGTCKSTYEKERLMESECATLRFLNEYTGVPAPKIYAYDVRYKRSLDLKPESEIKLQNSSTNGVENTTENTVGWPFILLENPESMASLPYWKNIEEQWKKKQFSDGLDHLEQMNYKKMLQQMVMVRMELAEHPLSACGYLTLDNPYWRIKSQQNSRKVVTPKAAFGIRPCIYDACEPFTNSIVAAFDSHPRQWLLPSARASNSLNSVTVRFRHLLTHGNVTEKDHFVAVWQLQALLYELFGSRYENGPFILQYPDLLPDNIFISGGLIDWERASVVPIQVAACPPRMCLGQLQYSNGGPSELSLAEIHERYLVRCYINMGVSETHDKDNIWECSDYEGRELFLSQVLGEEMFLPMCLLDELCNGLIDLSSVGKAAIRCFPLIYEMVKGHSWDSVKEAVMNKGVMRFALEDWEEEHIVKYVESADCEQKTSIVEDKVFVP